jgi:hypothetical protein
MPYMCRLDGVRNLERHPAKIVSGHDALLFCITSMLSHDLGWRGSCRITSNSPCSSGGTTFNSTRRDCEGRWL